MDWLASLHWQLLLAELFLLAVVVVVIWFNMRGKKR